MHIKDILWLWKLVWRDRDGSLAPDDEQKIAAFGESLREPDRAIFKLWRRGLSTQKIARRLNIQRDGVRYSLNQSYATMRVTVFPREDASQVRENHIPLAKTRCGREFDGPSPP